MSYPDAGESPPESPPLAHSDPSLTLPRLRSPEKAADSSSSRLVPDFNLPFRRSNPSLSAIFATTSGSAPVSRSSSFINTGTPPIPQIGQSIFSPGPQESTSGTPNAYRDLILRSFVPHVAVYPSQDVEDLLAQKGFPGGLLQLIRPYGETVQGKVTIRDSSGSSKSWEDFGVRFGKLKDGIDGPRLAERKSTDIRSASVDGLVDQYFPASSARLRTGGDIPYIEDTVAKHLAFSEGQTAPGPEDYLTHGMTGHQSYTPHNSPFHALYLRRLLSGIPLTPHETFSHPVACVVAISSRHPDPIEELRNMYANTTAGDQRLPQWVNPEYLRYYVLVHDEDHDDAQRSIQLFDQMKRHFGLHCHLLRLRSEQCVSSDDDCVRLPICEWLSAAEELEEIRKQENFETTEDTGPFLPSSDVVAIRAFIREMTTQSLVPLMERSCAQWNDQIASRRRGLTGRFTNIAKKWSPFSTLTSRTTSSPLSSTSNTSASTNPNNPSNPNSNYNSVSGFYPPTTPEALMRKLADYAFLLRDFKLASQTYDILRTDYSADKAWTYYAGANEMAALTMLISPQPLSAKTRAEGVDTLLEAASYSYLARAQAPYAALRTLAVAVELLLLRGGSAADDAARWACRITELNLTGSLGHAIWAERVAASFASRKGVGSRSWGARPRKSAIWSVFAAEAWCGLGRYREAERNLGLVWGVYDVGPPQRGAGTTSIARARARSLVAGRMEMEDEEREPFSWQGMRIMLEDLRDTIKMRLGNDDEGTAYAFSIDEKLSAMQLRQDDEEEDMVEETEMLGANIKVTRAGVGVGSVMTDPLGVGVVPVGHTREDEEETVEEALG